MSSQKNIEGDRYKYLLVLNIVRTFNWEPRPARATFGICMIMKRYGRL